MQKDIRIQASFQPSTTIAPMIQISTGQEPVDEGGKDIPFQVFVKTLTGRTLNIQIEPTATIDKLKQKIQEKEEIPLDQMNLICSGRRLLEGTLEDYKIFQWSTIHIVLSLRGGGTRPLPFAVLEEANEKRAEIGSKGPIWQRIAPGLNLRGTCSNIKCAAQDQVVWIPQGFGTFNINKVAQECLCPSCEERIVDVKNCGFFRCIFSIEGVRKGVIEGIRRLNVEAPNDHLLTFGDKEMAGEEDEYYFLRITTVPNDGASGCTLL